MIHTQEESSFRNIFVSGAIFAGLAVVLGAFAAHGLKQNYSEYAVSLFETASRYQMYHGLALCITALLVLFRSNLNLPASPWLSRAAWAFGIGIVVFSGSLYLLALSSLKWFGMITPIGGLSFILGWVFLVVAVTQRQN